MAFTDINSEARLVQKTFADDLHERLGWESVYAWNDETFGPHGTLGRDSIRDAVLRRDLRAALARLNPMLPEAAREEAFQKLTQVDFSRSLPSTTASSTASSATACQSAGANPAAKPVTATHGSSTSATARPPACPTTGSSPCGS
jgi:hypothetical protein